MLRDAATRLLAAIACSCCSSSPGSSGGSCKQVQHAAYGVTQATQ
jgi:hypothetical protein